MPLLSEARYENRTLKPSRDLPLREGESVIIGIRRPVTSLMYGLFSTDEKTTDGIISLDGGD